MAWARGCICAPISGELSGGAELSTEYLGWTIYVLVVGSLPEAFDDSACSLAGTENADDSSNDSM